MPKIASSTTHIMPDDHLVSPDSKLMNSWPPGFTVVNAICHASWKLLTGAPLVLIMTGPSIINGPSATFVLPSSRCSHG